MLAQWVVDCSGGIPAALVIWKCYQDLLNELCCCERDYGSSTLLTDLINILLVRLRKGRFPKIWRSGYPPLR